MTDDLQPQETIPPEESTPVEFDLAGVLMDLHGLGVVELQKPIELETQNGKKVVFTLSNIPTDKEIESLLASEEFKGHHWMQRIKSEILSRAITTLNGVHLDQLVNPYVKDPDGKQVHVRTALRDLIMSWGPETLGVVWKILMTHCQNLEDHLMASFPDAMIMTEYEKSFYERASELVDELSRGMATDLIEESGLIESK